MKRIGLLTLYTLGSLPAFSHICATDYSIMLGNSETECTDTGVSNSVSEVPT